MIQTVFGRKWFAMFFGGIFCTEQFQVQSLVRVMSGKQDQMLP